VWANSADASHLGKQKTRRKPGFHQKENLIKIKTTWFCKRRRNYTRGASWVYVFQKPPFWRNVKSGSKPITKREKKEVPNRKKKEA